MNEQSNAVPESLRRKVLEDIDASADKSVATLREFARIASVYRDLNALKSASEFMADALTTGGVAGRLEESGTLGKHSVLGLLSGAQHDAAKSLILNGHMDVYPPSNVWCVEPFSGVIRDNRLYGQGVTDMKAGIMAMALAASHIARSGVRLGGDLYVHAIPNHYNGGDGTRTALDSGLHADYAVVGEPSDLKLAIAQNGILYVNVTVQGTPTHVGSQQLGTHSVRHAAQLIEDLYAVQFSQKAQDEVGGRCHLNVSAVNAEGAHRSLVPEKCTFTGDIRFTPSVGRDGAYDAVENAVRTYRKNHAGINVSLETDPTCLRNPRNATSVPSDARIAQIVDKAAAEVTGKPTDIICHPAWPDTPVFNDSGVEAVTFGPGSTACYWPDEFVEIDDFIKAIKIYALVAMDACGVADCR